MIVKETIIHTWVARGHLHHGWTMGAPQKKNAAHMSTGQSWANVSEMYGFFFLKWWLSPTTRKKHPTKNHQHFGVEIGETHHFRKHPLLPYQTFLLRAENGKFHGGIRNTKKQRTRRVWKINQRAYKTNALQRSQPKSKRNISSTWRGEWC